jgi:prolipoprotein diacylglyceryltransferase
VQRRLCPRNPAPPCAWLLLLGIGVALWWWSRLPGQHFHLYLIACGCFRFVHEFARDTPRIGLGISGRQIAALACVALGVRGFVRRARSQRNDGGT